MQVAIDSSVFVAILSPNDKWNQQAVALLAALASGGHTAVYFDCVVAETLTTTLRRLHEQRRTSEIFTTFARLELLLPSTAITWTFNAIADLYDPVLDLMKSSSGTLNFHDALIALSCRERNIPAIASFDEDFDQLSWLRRLASPADVINLHDL